MQTAPHADGVVIGGFTDHHVHLQLVDHASLAGSRLGRVIDLGGNPEVLTSYAGSPRFVSLRSLNDRKETLRSLSERAPATQARRGELRRASVEFAGAFLTPPGGYPSDRSWAPTGSFREIADEADAATAVAEMADAGATRIKVASNSTAGPVFADAVFRTIVELAGARGLPVVAHVEGPGQAQRAARLGAATLAHAPFTERLTEEEIAEQATSVSWISTLAIHDDADRARAIDNVRRFHAAGGAVLYGTDMGNGPTPVDLNPREIDALREAGVEGAALLQALHPVDPSDPASVQLLLPEGDADPLHAQILEV
jgi:hypothetical protein